MGTAQELLWSNFSKAWDKGVGDYFLGNSLVVVVFGVLGTMLFGSMVAYVLARYEFPGNRFIYYLFAAGMMFPIFLAIVPLFFVVQNFALISTYQGLILVYIAYSLPFTVFFLHAFFRTLPTAIAEAALVDGAGHATTFFRVMLPMAKPGLRQRRASSTSSASGTSSCCRRSCRRTKTGALAGHGDPARQSALRGGLRARCSRR